MRISDWSSDVCSSDLADGFYDVQDEHWSGVKAVLRAAFRTDDDGRFSFKPNLPKSYPIPTDGTVGEMLAATNRSPMRAAHIHFKVEKDGFDPLITHVFAEGDEFLDSDAVFGVRGSCIGNYVRHDTGQPPFGDDLEQPFSTLDYRFTLQPVRQGWENTLY